MADYNKVTSYWSGGNLHFSDLNNVDVLVIGTPTTGVRAIPAGYVTVVTTSKTLALTDIGRINYVLATSTVTLTLPYVGSTCVHASYNIVNGNSSGQTAIIVLAYVTTETFSGCGWASTAVAYQLTNAASTSYAGDSITLKSTGSTNLLWLVTGLVGTWVSTT